MTMQQIDKKEYFRVPEGYFESFATKMMDMLPEQPFQPMQVKKNYWRFPYINAAVAACALAVVSVTTLLIHQSYLPKETAQQQRYLDIDAVNGSYSVEDAADCAMIDKLTMYEMITE